MRQFTKEEYQILLEGMEQLHADYKEAESWDFGLLRKKYMIYGFCYYLFKNPYLTFFEQIFNEFINPNKISEFYLFPTPVNYWGKGIYTKGITDRINWLEQKILEIKNILNESNTQN